MSAAALCGAPLVALVPPGGAEVALGFAATAAMLIYTCLGLPLQVAENARRRSTAGLSLPMFSLSFAAFGLFAAYGAVQEPIDWFVVASNVPGTLLTATILVQFHLYRRVPPAPPVA